LIPSAVFLIYVLVCEGWVWVMRLRAYHALAVTENLAPGYSLSPRSEE
jgi:hypothetical protein